MYVRAHDEREFEDERQNTIKDSLYVGESPSEEQKKLQRQWSFRRFLLEDVTASAKIIPHL